MANTDLQEIFADIATEFRLPALASGSDNTPPTQAQTVLFVNFAIGAVISLLKPQMAEVGNYTAGRLDKLTTLQTRVTDTSDSGSSGSPLGYVPLPTSPRPICYLEITVNAYPATEVTYRDFVKLIASDVFLPPAVNPIYSFENNRLYYFPCNAGDILPPLSFVNTIIFKYLALPADMVILSAEVFPISKDLMETVTEAVKTMVHAQDLKDDKMQDHLQKFFQKALGTDPKKISGLVGVAQQLVPAVRT